MTFAVAATRGSSGWVALLVFALALLTAALLALLAARLPWLVCLLLLVAAALLLPALIWAASFGKANCVGGEGSCSDAWTGRDVLVVVLAVVPPFAASCCLSAVNALSGHRR